ncbi:hypothetical protein IANJMKHF_00449 [Klebsiella phage CPRSA]|nr:hypothetical protein IANJMKHF_00449 [Klebsiella phage CPRSA]
MAKAKYKIDSVGLFDYLKGLNEGRVHVAGSVHLLRIIQRSANL